MSGPAEDARIDCVLIAAGKYHYVDFPGWSS